MLTNEYVYVKLFIIHIIGVKYYSRDIIYHIALDGCNFLAEKFCAIPTSMAQTGLFWG
jgi:hypothetical protein